MQPNDHYLVADLDEMPATLEGLLDRFRHYAEVIDITPLASSDVSIPVFEPSPQPTVHAAEASRSSLEIKLTH